MSRARKKQSADRFRRQISRSNELHAEYLADPDFYEAYDRYTDWQLSYLLTWFRDLHEIEGYGEAIDFIMSDLAGVGVAGRDRDLERVAPVITATLTERALDTVASAAELNTRVLEINLAICRNLMADGRLPARIAEHDYRVACRRSSSYDECVGLTHLVADLGETLKALVGVPMIGVTLRAMHRPAHAAGFGALQDFLETGYHTFRQIPDIDHFLEQIRLRMTDVFAHIYLSPIGGAGDAPAVPRPGRSVAG
ncbi:MAG: hypothetical protein OEV41_08440 [Gammaproteobacteria bacterium]|nr:hypothetical protein [Gammaproteobacteria bacterium]MDH4351948.1 hypothetical protein [Gemmatimonadota bacterium]MDH5310724.1 hypothetical protein [Gammaproteobacteria bacterium]